MLMVGRNKNLDWAINFAFVIQIYRLESSIFVTYHSGEFDEINNTITDVRTIIFASYEDAEKAEYALSMFYHALNGGAKVFNFNEVDIEIFF